MKSIINTTHVLAVLLLAFFLCTIYDANAQLKIGNNPTAIDNNSLFEMETTNMGLLPPRVALNSSSSASPLTAPVPAGMTVFSIGGTLTDGYYFWNGSKWIRLVTGDVSSNLVAKTANCTLLKTETMVLASNDITVTLPAITADDNGLAIMVKNNGTYTDLVTIAGTSGATLDNIASFTLTRYQSRTFVAYNGVWVTRDRESRTNGIYDVGPQCSWISISQVLAFLNEHMSTASVVRICGGTFTVETTQVINLPYSVTFQALSYGSTTIGPASGLAGLPMFDCRTECYFKMIMFDATTLAGYGLADGEDAVHLNGSGKYNEIKDCTFERFNNGIKITTDAELWLFECDIMNAKKNGVLIESAVAGAKLRISETDFLACYTGVNMKQGADIIVQLALGAYDNVNATDTCIKYNPSGCSFEKMQITNNAWNNVGRFLSGFDFTRSDGRDANAYIEANAGMEDKTPHCKFNVRDNALPTTVTSLGTWYKASWTNASNYSCKWGVNNNRLTYLPDNKRDVVVYITGNIKCNNTSRVISIGLVKNNTTTTRYGECDLRITASNSPFQFATVIYLEDVSHDDYFELFCTSNYNSDVVTFQDVQCFAEAK